MFKEKDLKDLAAHLRDQSKELLKKEAPDSEGAEQLKKLSRQLEAIRYNGMLFQSILENYDVDYDLMVEPLERLPLRISDAGVLSKVLVKWRLSNNI